MSGARQSKINEGDGFGRSGRERVKHCLNLHEVSKKNPVEFCCIFCCSDSRVTNGTTRLIQSLLVLDPKKRLAASQVLDVLSNTMRTW